MAAILADGWLEVDYTGNDLAAVHIAVSPGLPDDDTWQPAFLDYGADGQRVAKIRPPAGAKARDAVWLRVAGQVTSSRIR